MKIQKLNVERCGGWSDLSLPLAADGLTVLYGPNEAGKSTLMRFIRGVLYGFDPRDEVGLGARPGRHSCAGELLLRDGDEEYTVRRESEWNGRGGLRVTTRDAVLDSESAIDRLRGQVSRDLFERVFAVGLSELQELGTLQGAEVARHVYEMSLGDAGRRILAAWEQGAADRRSLWDAESGSGELPRLTSEIRSLDARLQECRQRDARIDAAEQERDRLLEMIDDQRSRQRGLQEQLRGHQFLDRVWGPWRRQQDLMAERDALDALDDFPEQGLERLDELDLELADLQRQRRRLRAEAARIRQHAAGARINDPIRRHGAAVERLAEQAAELEELEAQLPRRRNDVQAARLAMEHSLRSLGSGWSEERIEQLDASPAATRELFDQARRYRAQLVHRSRMIRRYQRWSSDLQREQGAQASALRVYDGSSPEEAREELSRRIEALEQLQSLKLQADVHAQGVAALQEQLRSIESPRELPPYFYTVLTLFGLGGAALAVLGGFRVYEGLATGGAGLIGLILALVGVCCAGLTWTMKQQFDPSTESTRPLRQRLAAAEDELDDVRRELGRLSREFLLNRPLRGGRKTADDAEPVSIDEQLLAARQQLSRLEHASRDQAALQLRRERMGELRSVIRELQRGVSEARRNWCHALQQVGLDESLQIKGSLTAWETALTARQAAHDCRAARRDLEADEQRVQKFRSEVAELAEKLDDDDPGPTSVCERVAGWRQRWEEVCAARERLSLARSELRSRRQESKALRRQLRRFRQERAALLASVSAVDRAGFLAAHRAYQRSIEIDELLADLRDELATAARSEPELAVVEDDLQRLDPEENRLAIATVRSELADLEQDLQRSHEELGQVKQSLETWEADRTEVELRCERAQRLHELHHATERWCAVELALDLLESQRARLERDCQPETLARASRYLQQLTLSRYERVWMPLGERRLVVDDDQQSLRVEQLSNGTREQLFLAIRLALIDQFRERGVELPVILDDVFVNFDQLRTEAAIDTLVDYARGGRQVLMFTCHLHLARMCEDTGVRTILLPDSTTSPRRRVG